MSKPLQVLCVGLPAPDALADAQAQNLGPFACTTLPWPADTGVEPAATLVPAGASVDVLLLAPPEAQVLMAWPQLVSTALAHAVVVLVPEIDAALLARLLPAGVQAMLPAIDVADPQRLALALRQAVERKRLEVATRLAYATDLGTGLPNHPQLLEHMNHLLALREREPAPMALIVVRLQGLAQTQAALGNEAANVLRRKAAVRLRAALRASDVVASIGVDAFAVLLAWIDSPQDGERVAAKLAQTLVRPLSVAGREQRLGVTVGLASYPEHGRQADALLHRALAQAASMATLGGEGTASAADRGPQAAANDD
jgi:diguanylate cyclase